MNGNIRDPLGPVGVVYDAMGEAPAKPIAEPAGDVGLGDEQIIAICKQAGIRWIEPYEDDSDFPGSFDMVTMAEMRQLIRRLAQRQGRAVADVPYDQHERECLKLIDERDRLMGVIDDILDEVLGNDRAEWSSAYGYGDALVEVEERMAARTEQPASAAVGDGWKLVPAEATRDMLEAGAAFMALGQGFAAAYKAALAAAPDRAEGGL